MGPIAVGVSSVLICAPAAAERASAHGVANLELIAPADERPVEFASPYVERDPVDLAMQKFGQALSRAELNEQQSVRSACRSGVPSGASAEQRYAWAASCRYSRH